MKNEKKTEEKILEILKNRKNKIITAKLIAGRLGITKHAVYYYLRILIFEKKILFTFAKSKESRKPFKNYFLNQQKKQ